MDTKINFSGENVPGAIADKFGNLIKSAIELCSESEPKDFSFTIRFGDLSATIYRTSKDSDSD